MDIRTTQEQLEAVQAAIEKVEKGQAVTFGGDTITRANLKTLYDREDQLMKRYHLENGNGGLTINHGIRGDRC